MQVNRKDLLALLTRAKAGLTRRDVLEQSASYVFTGGKLVTYNEDVLFRGESPFGDVDFAVPAEDLIRLVSRFDDDEINVDLKEEEVRIKAGNKSAGLTCQKEIALPFRDVPMPKSWDRLTDGTFEILQQAAETCGSDCTLPLTTVVHVTPDVVESCDNYRLLRASGPTGIGRDVCLPASGLSLISHLEVVKVSVSDGWLHLKTKAGEVVSLRCSGEKYHTGVEALLDLGESESIRMPSGLKDTIARAEVMSDGGYDSRLQVCLEEGSLTVRSRKESGWYREKRKVAYEGRRLEFEVHPSIWSDLVSRARTVSVGRGRMLIETGRVQYVVSLTAPQVKDED